MKLNNSKLFKLIDIFVQIVCIFDGFAQLQYSYNVFCSPSLSFFARLLLSFSIFLSQLFELYLIKPQNNANHRCVYYNKLIDDKNRLVLQSNWFKIARAHFAFSFAFSWSELIYVFRKNWILYAVCDLNPNS